MFPANLFRPKPHGVDAVASAHFALADQSISWNNSPKFDSTAGTRWGVKFILQILFTCRATPENGHEGETGKTQGRADEKF